jgi:hypothetical protein
MFTIDELIQSYTPADVQTHLENLLEAINVPAKSWRSGSVAKRLLVTVSTLGSQATVLSSSIVAGLFLLLGSGSLLSAHAEDVYDVTRIPATFATGFVVLTNTGGTVFTVGANECIVRAGDTKKTYRITSGFTLGAFATSAPLPIEAMEAGSASTAAATEINEFETPLTLVTVSNPAAVVGRDAETDADLVQRCLLKKATWSPHGPADAYEYAARSATLVGGTPTNITRVKVSPSSSTGEVYVYCATPSGTPTSDEIAAALANVQTYAQTDTDKVFVLGATPVVSSQTVTIWARGGVQATIIARAQAAVAKLIATYPIGGIAKVEGGQGYLYLEAIGAACIRSSIDESTGQSAGYEVFDVDFGVSDADTPLNPNEFATNTITFDARIR